MSVPSHHLRPVLRRIWNAYRSHNDETETNYMANVLLRTLFVMQCIMHICSNDQRLRTSRLGVMSAVSLARMRMDFMMHRMRESEQFPLRLLKINRRFVIPRFMVVGLYASDYSVSEIRAIIARVAGELCSSSESCSPSWISPRLLRRTQRDMTRT